MLALSFLLVVGVMLIAEGFDHKVPKGYIYFAMAFSVAVEMLNIRMRKKNGSGQAGQAARAVREELALTDGRGQMCFGLLRFIGVIWFFGFIVLALAATSSYLYSTESPARARAALAVAPAHVADVADRADVGRRALAPAPRLTDSQGETIMAFSAPIFRGGNNARRWRAACPSARSHVGGGRRHRHRGGQRRRLRHQGGRHRPARHQDALRRSGLRVAARGALLLQPDHQRDRRNGYPRAAHGRRDRYLHARRAAGGHQVHAQLPPAAERGAPHVSRHRP